jgi:hypothetical protein
MSLNQIYSNVLMHFGTLLSDYFSLLLFTLWVMSGTSYNFFPLSVCITENSHCVLSQMNGVGGEAVEYCASPRILLLRAPS